MKQAKTETMQPVAVAASETETAVIAKPVNAPVAASPKKQKPQVAVLKKVLDTSVGGFLDTITKMTGDPSFVEKFSACVTLMVNNAWKQNEYTGDWENPYAKVPPLSFMQALQKCAMRKVLPDGVNAVIVPYTGGKNPRCELTVTAKGMSDCALHEGVAKSINAMEVCENDDIEINFGEVTTFRVDPKSSRGDVIGCCAFAILPDGTRKTVYVPLDDLLKIQGFAKSSNIWETWTIEMFKKTAIRRLFKYMQTTSAALNNLIALDNDTFDMERKPATATRNTATTRALNSTPIRAIAEAEPAPVNDTGATDDDDDEVFG